MNNGLLLQGEERITGRSAISAFAQRETNHPSRISLLYRPMMRGALPLECPYEPPTMM